MTLPRACSPWISPPYTGGAWSTWRQGDDHGAGLRGVRRRMTRPSSPCGRAGGWRATRLRSASVAEHGRLGGPCQRIIQRRAFDPEGPTNRRFARAQVQGSPNRREFFLADGLGPSTPFPAALGGGQPGLDTFLRQGAQRQTRPPPEAHPPSEARGAQSPRKRRTTRRDRSLL